MSVSGFPAIVDCKGTCVDTTMGEKECLISSANILHGIICMISCLFHRNSCEISQVVVVIPWVAPL